MAHLAQGDLEAAVDASGLHWIWIPNWPKLTWGRARWSMRGATMNWQPSRSQPSCAWNRRTRGPTTAWDGRNTTGTDGKQRVGTSRRLFCLAAGCLE
jgi:hypothetical protein